MQEESAQDTEQTREEKYGIVAKIAKVMDDYYVDPLLSLIPGGIGDAVSQALTLPAIYVAAFRVRSLSLTLAMIYHTLCDFLIGLVPILGDVYDFFNKSHKKNHKLLSGFIRGDEATIRSVRSGAWKSVVLIILLTVLIYFALRMIGATWQIIYEFIGKTFQ